MTNKWVRIKFLLPKFNATKIVMLGFLVDELTKSRHDVILGRDIINSLRLYIRFSEHVIVICKTPSDDVNN